MSMQGRFEVSSHRVAKFIAIAIAIFILLILGFASTYIVEPGHRGVLVTMGKVSPGFRQEGFGFKSPFITTVVPVSIRQQTREMKAECYSSDLQQISMGLNVLYRIPESSVVKIYQEYSGEPFESLIYPRVSEAIKEVTALQSAEMIVKKREEIKTKALAAAKLKVGSLLTLEDIVLANMALTKELEQAIEAKMVQEQEAAKAKFIQQKTEIEANTAVIRAKGEAEAIRIRGQALKETPNLIELQIVEKWDGHSPLVVGGGKGANILLPLKDTAVTP
ncbi:MAG: prohibitin family protein [Deltaproteobacteria bacterium]|nr:prohibitin family protein [Deltaproteobacteria bacterium]